WPWPTSGGSSAASRTSSDAVPRSAGGGTPPQTPGPSGSEARLPLMVSQQPLGKAGALTAPGGPPPSLSWKKKLLLLATSVVVSLLLAEVGVRLLGLDQPMVFEPDKELGWYTIPGARAFFHEEGGGLVEISPQGLRDRERSFAKQPGTFRIG